MHLHFIRPLKTRCPIVCGSAVNFSLISICLPKLFPMVNVTTIVYFSAMDTAFEHQQFYNPILSFSHSSLICWINVKDFEKYFINSFSESVLKTFRETTFTDAERDCHKWLSATAHRDSFQSQSWKPFGRQHLPTWNGIVTNSWVPLQVATVEGSGGLQPWLHWLILPRLIQRINFRFDNSRTLCVYG